MSLSFAKNFAFDDYVEQLLSQYPYVVTNHTINQDTDIYITDVYDLALPDVFQLVWNKVPDRTELEKLDTYIIQIQKNKVKNIA